MTQTSPKQRGGGCANGTALAAGEGEAEDGLENRRLHARDCLHDLHGMDG